jgi:alkylation response protein AidB-like acyl-CoA dehydrogenase
MMDVSTTFVEVMALTRADLVEIFRLDPTDKNPAMVHSDDMLGRARQMADGVLFPAALSVDRMTRVPASHLDALAREGLYALAGPAELGGPEDRSVAGRVVELLAGGCLATTFVWMQHHSAVTAVTNAAESVRAQWLEPLCRGHRRAGVALTALRPGKPAVRARVAAGGYVLDGTAAWVTGWGMIDTLHVAARDEADTIVFALLDAVPGSTIAVEPLDLVAANASATVKLTFAQHFVPATRVTATLPYAEWPARDAAGLRMNGSLALGLAARCSRLIGPNDIDAEIVTCRKQLDEAGPDGLPAARAAASELAMRAATTLLVHTGAGGVLRNQHAQRLVREAAFLLVFGSRPAIREDLLRLLTH